MIKKSKYKFIMFLSVALIALALCIIPWGVAFGWFSDNKTHESDSDLEPFSMILTAWFDPYLSGGNRLMVDDLKNLQLNLSDQTADNYYSRLHVSGQFKGTVDALMRIRITHLWSQTTTSGDVSIPSRANLSFIYDSDYFIDNLIADTHYYFCRVADFDSTLSDEANLKNYTLGRANNNWAFRLFSGIKDTIKYESTVNLTLVIEGALIQANRVAQMPGWGTLPKPKVEATGLTESWVYDTNAKSTATVFNKRYSKESK